MKSFATLTYLTTDVDDLYKLLKSEDYDFKEKEIFIEIKKKSEGVEVMIQAKTPHLLKVATTAVNDSCEIIRKTNDVLKNE